MPAGIRLGKPRKAGRKFRIQLRTYRTHEVEYRVFDSEESAWGAYNALKAHLENISSPETEKAIDEYIEHCRRKQLKEKTLEIKRFKLVLLLPLKPIRQVTTKLIQKKLDAVIATHAPDTIRSSMAEVRQFFEFVVKKGYVNKSPVPGVDLSGVGKKRKGKRQLHLAEAQRLTDYCLEHPNHRSAAILFGVMLGMRAGEVIGLNGRDIDLQNNLVYIHDAKTPTGNRTLEIPDVMLSMLRRLMKKVGPDEPVFRKRSGRLGRCWPRDAVRRACKALGLPIIAFHGLRGTHSSIAHLGGATSELVAKQLGHANIRVTREAYTRRGVVESADAQKASSALISNPRTAETQDDEEDAESPEGRPPEHLH